MCVVALAGALAVGVAANAGASGFRATKHSWQVGVNATNVHAVASGGTLKICASQSFSAVTPSLSYAGATVGESYTEKVIGPAAAGTITILGLRNIDNDKTPLKFTRATGSWNDTYAIISFPGAVGHSTLPPGSYTFEALLGGKVLASTSITLATKPGC